jgi:excisionase family DNA binding protein
MTYLTTRDLQDLIRVDKSTIYRMAEDGRLPAVKVGRQWRFPEAAVREMLGHLPQPEPSRASNRPLIEALDPTATQAVADLAADALGAMVVITGMDGQPLSDVANPCGLFGAVAAEPDVIPKFRRSHFEFLCARSFIRVGNELLGMVIVGGLAPEVWPPDAAHIESIADELGVATELVAEHIDEVFYLDSSEQQRILDLLPGFAVVLSHMAENAGQLVGRLDAIASLAGDSEATRSTS